MIENNLPEFETTAPEQNTPPEEAPRIQPTAETAPGREAPQTPPTVNIPQTPPVQPAPGQPYFYTAPEVERQTYPQQTPGYMGNCYPNNTCQQPIPPRPVMAQSTAHPAARPQTPKKKNRTLQVTLLALCCALVGSVFGGLLTGAVMRNAYENQSSVSTKADITPSSDKTEKPTLSMVTNESGLLTPAQVYQQNVSAVVGIANESTTYNVFGQASQSASSGSGFLISSDGEILTNYHVVEGAQTLTVSLYDGTEYSARVLGYEEESDVALLKIEGTDLPFVTIGDSDGLYVGDEVAAIGNPLGELTYSMTVGYVSSMNRDINTDGNPINMMQIDAAINSGNSGGPLFDMTGSVIGITTAKYSGTTGSGTSIEGIGFAIPINDVMAILDDLREHGGVPDRAYMGVTVGTVAASEAMGTPAGALIDSVVSGGSASKAGLQPGDIITAMDGVTVEGLTDLSKCLRNYRAGDTVTLTVYRSGQTITLNLTFDAKPSSAETAATTEEETQGFDPWSFFLP